MPGVAHPEPDAVLAQSGEILVRANYRPVFGTFNTLIGLSEGMGDGADWHDLAAAVSVNDTASRVTIEFGADRTLNEVRLQADLNDTYLVTFSTNGKDFSDPWVLGPIQEGAGLQTHQTPEGFSRTPVSSGSRRSLVTARTPSVAWTWSPRRDVRHERQVSQRWRRMPPWQATARRP